MYKNILILSAGRRIELINIFKKETNKIKYINIYLADSKPSLAPTCRLNKNIIKLPNCNSKSYIKKLKNESIINDIKLIIPTIDTELEILSKSRKIFSQLGIDIIISNYDFIKKTNNKILTKEIFDLLKIKYPKIYDADNLRFPCINKPILGSGSKDITVLKNYNYLSIKLIDNKKNFFSKFISGYKEFTVDMYYDKKHVLKNLIARERVDVRNGEVIKSVTNYKVSKFLLKKFKKIHGALGPITVQVLINTKSMNIYGIEINPRLGGGCTLSYKAGYNFAKNIINEYIFGKAIRNMYQHKDKLLLLRYDKDFIA